MDASRLVAALGTAIMAMPAASLCLAQPVRCAESPAVDLSRAVDSADARKQLMKWFECEECEDGELENVVRYCDAVVPVLAAALQEGLSPSRRAELSGHLQSTYRKLVEYARSHPGQSALMSKDDYVRKYLANADALYRSRAAIALIDIDTSAARDALRLGLRVHDLRPDLRETINGALQ